MRYLRQLFFFTTFSSIFFSCTETKTGPISVAEVRKRNGTNEQFGYINAEGKEIVPCRFSPVNYSSSGWSEGFYGVCENGKQGFYDSLGNLAIPLMYDEAARFGEGRAMVRLGNDVWIITKNNNKIKTVRINNEYEVEGLGRFNENLAAIGLSKKNGPQHFRLAFVDTSGEVVISPDMLDKDIAPEMVATFEFHCNRLLVIDPHTRKIGFVNRNGKLVIPCIYDEGRAFDNKRTAFVIRKVFDDSVRNYVTRKMLIDTAGLVIREIADSTWLYDSDLDMAIFFSYANHKYGLLSGSGDTIVPPRYEVMFGIKEGLCSVRKDGKFGFIDTSGKVVIPLQFAYAYQFSDSLAHVKNVAGKYGFIDHSGKVVLPFEYENASSFSGGMAKVTKNGKKGFIDKQGQFRQYDEYDQVSSFHYLGEL